MKKSAKEIILENYLKSSKNRSAIARAIAEPLRRRLDFAGLARALFSTSCYICDDQEATIKVDIYLNRITAYRKKTFMVCATCLKSTKAKLKKIKEGAVEELPLYVSDENPFIKDYATRALQRMQP